MRILKPFHALSQAMAHGGHNFEVDTVIVLLCKSEPLQAENKTRADLPDELPMSGGYMPGVLTVTSSQQSGGLYTLEGFGPTFAAKGGQIGPFRFAVLCNKENDNLIGFADYMEEITLREGESMKIVFNNPILTLGLR